MDSVQAIVLDVTMIGQTVDVQLESKAQTAQYSKTVRFSDDYCLKCRKPNAKEHVLTTSHTVECVLLRNKYVFLA